MENPSLAQGGFYIILRHGVTNFWIWALFVNNFKNHWNIFIIIWVTFSYFFYTLWVEHIFLKRVLSFVLNQILGFLLLLECVTQEFTCWVLNLKMHMPMEFEVGPLKIGLDEAWMDSLRYFKNLQKIESRTIYLGIKIVKSMYKFFLTYMLHVPFSQKDRDILTVRALMSWICHVMSYASMTRARPGWSWELGAQSVFPTWVARIPLFESSIGCVSRKLESGSL